MSLFSILKKFADIDTGRAYFMELNLLELAHKIRNLLADNKVWEALKYLRESLKNHPSLDESILQVARYQEIRTEIREGIADFELVGVEKNRIRASMLDLVRDLEREAKAKTQVFISHSSEEFSKTLAKNLYEKLIDDGYVAFLDFENLRAGDDWAEVILGAIKASDYFVLLLSESANSSEMVLKEIAEARRLKDKYGKPQILPIRVAWPEGLQLNYKLQGWLQRLQHLNWETDSDTEKMIKNLMEVVSRRGSLSIIGKIDPEEAKKFAGQKMTAPLPVAPLEVPRGAVRLESKYYVEREHEQSFIQRVTEPGALLRIRGARQYGKTSLLARVMNHAKEKEHVVISIDFQDISEQTLSDLATMIWEFCYNIAEELDLEEKLEEVWAKKRDPKQMARTFMKRVVLQKIEKPILLAMDEADRLFVYQQVSKDFFLMLRAWHEKSKSSSQWEQLKMALSYSTEAKLAIADLNASPFNVGEEALIVPFSDEQVSDLAKRHGLDLKEPQIEELLYLVGGQPYLVRRALYLISKGEYSFEQLVQKATEDTGPFRDHLRHHLINVKQFEEICKAFEEIMQKGTCKDPILAGRLEAAGLIKESKQDHFEAANGLYHAYFKTKL